MLPGGGDGGGVAFFNQEKSGKEVLAYGKRGPFKHYNPLCLSEVAFEMLLACATPMDNKLCSENV